MERIYAAGSSFVRTHPVDTAHEDITKFCTHGGTKHQIGIQVEAGIAFDAGQVQGDNGNLFHAGFL